jgi:hypothetical protein
MNLLALDRAEARATGRSEQQGGVGDIGTAAVLSGAGTFEASAEERKLLCLLSDGRLLVAEG